MTGSTAQPVVQLKGINKYYGSEHVVRDLTLDVNEGEFLTILGSSGSGKTTTLRMVAGFEQPDTGQVLLAGVDVADKQPYERDVNTVFQNYALFPHMNIYDNVAYGLKMKKVAAGEIRARVSEMLALVQLEGFERRRPEQLSGGQKQRVAIARALANRPKILLLDEPLGALDLKLRKQMQLELKHLQRKLDITFLYVTHDQEEALTMSDRIAIMNGGVLEQVGTAHEIYEQPASAFVATFIGETNLFHGTVAAVDAVAGEAAVELGGGVRVPVRLRAGFSPAVGEAVGVSVRPERLRASAAPLPGVSLAATVREQVYVGSAVKGIVELAGAERVAVAGGICRVTRLAGEASALPAVGGTVHLGWDPADAWVVPEGPSAFAPAGPSASGAAAPAGC